MAKKRTKQSSAGIVTLSVDLPAACMPIIESFAQRIESPVEQAASVMLMVRLLELQSLLNQQTNAAMPRLFIETPQELTELDAVPEEVTEPTSEPQPTANHFADVSKKIGVSERIRLRTAAADAVEQWNSTVCPGAHVLFSPVMSDPSVQTLTRTQSDAWVSDDGFAVVYVGCRTQPVGLDHLTLSKSGGNDA